MILPPGAPREPRKRTTPPAPIRLEGTANMDAPNLLGAEYGEVPFQFEIIEYVPRQMYEKLRDDMLALRGQPWPTETRYVPEQSTFQERLWQRLKRLAPTTWAGGSGYCRDRTPEPSYLPNPTFAEMAAVTEALRNLCDALEIAYIAPRGGKGAISEAWSQARRLLDEKY